MAQIEMSATIYNLASTASAIASKSVRVDGKLLGENTSVENRARTTYASSFESRCVRIDAVRFCLPEVSPH